jgi:hypothetical protein
MAERGFIVSVSSAEVRIMQIARSRFNLPHYSTFITPHSINESAFCNLHSAIHAFLSTSCIVYQPVRP